MELLTKLLSSRKFLVLVASTIGLLITKSLKVQVEQSTIMEFVILIGSYLVAQGVSDHGKAAAKVEAIATLATAPFGEGTKTEKAAAIDAIKSV